MSISPIWESELENMISFELNWGLAGTILQYHSNGASGAYRSTYTAPFAVAIIDLNLISIIIPCYG